MISHPSVDALVVDDDPAVRAVLVDGLARHDMTVREAADGIAALAEVAARPPDIAVVDVGMPGISGVELVRRLRTEGLSLPLCILSARDEVDDRVRGLAAGADDYVVKPFSVTELAARLHALVRLHRVRSGSPVVVGDLVLDPGRRLTTRAGRELGLTTREFELLQALAGRPGQVLSRRQLLEQVWGYTWDVDTNVVDVFIGYLRRKTEALGEPRMLHTVRGVGFVLRP